MKTKKILLTIALLTLTFAIKAQDKYDFMIISYFPQGQSLTIATDKETLHEDVPVHKHEYVSENYLLKKVSEYQEKGWEVITFTNASYFHIVQGNGRSDQEFYAYLKKKKVQSK